MNENDKKRIARVDSSMYTQCKTRGYAAPADVFRDLGLLSEKDYRSWKAGRVDTLERVIQTNLNKINKIMKEVQSYARRQGLKPSFTVYKANGSKRPLRFSKSGDPSIERSYATHYVDSARTAQLKEEKQRLKEARKKEKDAQKEEAEAAQ